jgi:DNA-binding response OmpR family regulator
MRQEVIPDTTIIFLTGRTDITALVLSMELNVNDFLTKPFTVPELIVAVNIQLKKIVQESHRSVTNLLSKPT